MLSQSGHFPQLIGRGIQNLGQRTKPVNQFMGQGIDVPLGDGVKQNELQNPVIGPSLKPPGQKLRLHSLAVASMDGHRSHSLLNWVF